MKEQQKLRRMRLLGRIKFQWSAILLTLCFCTSLYSQNMIVKGQIRDSKGETVIGATVVVQGDDTKGTTSDVDGKFSLEVSPNAILNVSYIGYKGKSVPVKGSQFLQIVLEEISQNLEEVVVVGYGTQKRVNLTGSVATVTGDEISKRPVSNTSTLLQGMVPGLRVTSDKGQPGAEGVQFRIRGQGTYSSAGSDPLILINGVEGNLATIDPNIIESVSVLKDAASASIYGARAANGVILVTTKDGSKLKDQITLSYHANFAIHEATRLLDNLIWDSPSYMKYFNLAKKNTFLNGGAPTVGNVYTQEMIDNYTHPSDKEKYPSFNWLNYIFNPAFVQQHNLSVAGTSGKTSYNVSLSGLLQPGVMIGMKYNRYNATVDLTSTVNNWIRFGTYFTGSVSDRQQPRQGDTDTYLSGVSQAPTYMPWLPDDGSGQRRWSYKAYPFESNNKNVGAIVDTENFITEHVTDLNFQMWLELKLAKGLTWYTKGAAQTQNTRYKDWRTLPLPLFYTKTFTNPSTGITTTEGQEALKLNTGGTGLEVRMFDNEYYNLYSNLKYDWTSLNKLHKIALMGGFSMESNEYNYMNAYRLSYDYDLHELNAGAASTQTNGGYSEVWALMSGYGRFNYSLKDRYLVELNARYDGTSRIAKDTRWGFFPSGSVGWRLSEESWIKSLGWNWLDNAKLRASYGILGNQNISLYSYYASIAISGLDYPFDNNTVTSGAGQTTLNNKNLKWETTSIGDIGLDLTIFRGLSLTFDWYNKKTSGILRKAQTSSLVGLDPPFINDGEMQNSGVEFNLQYNKRISDGVLKGLQYMAGFYVEKTQNKLTKFGAQELEKGQIRREGLPYNEFYTFKAIGIFRDQNEIDNSPKQWNDKTLPGDLKYLDANKDGKVDDNDRVIIPGRFPKMEYSVNFSFNWKGFDFSAFGQGVYGVKHYASDWGLRPFYQGTPPTTDYVKNMWTEENHNAKYPRLYFADMGGVKNRRESSYWLHDGSYFRVKNLTLGYTIPSNLTRKIKIERLRVYFSGDNLFTFTRFPVGGDPERNYNSVMGTRLVYYPQNKIYSMGINLDF